MAKFTNGLLCFLLFCDLCASGAFHPFWVTLGSLSLRALLLKKLALSLNVILDCWFFVFVSLVATKTGSRPRPQCDFRVVGFVFLGFPGWFSYVRSMSLKLACLVFASSQVGWP